MTKFQLIKTLMFATLAMLSLLVEETLGQDCGPVNGAVTIAGGTVVQPIANAWAGGYTKKCPTVNVTVEAGGSTVGAGRVCGQLSRGTPVDIGDMSRKFLPTEATTSDQVNFTCVIGDTTRKITQIEVGIDGLTVALVAGGYGAQCVRRLGGLTIDQLRWIFSSYTRAQLIATGWDSTALKNSDGNDLTHLWSELDAGCRNITIKIAGRDSLSGTYASFRDAVFADASKGETFDNKRPGGYFSSTDDKTVVNFLQTSSELEYGDAIAYFGFSFYLDEGETLYGSPIKNSDGNYVIPSKTSIADGTYNPLSRRLYMQVWNDVTNLADVRPFMQFGLSNTGTQLTDQTGYVGLPLDDRNIMLARLGAPPVSDAVPPTPAPAGGGGGGGGEDTSCGLLGLSLFCLSGCGFFGRLLGLCD